MYNYNYKIYIQWVLYLILREDASTINKAINQHLGHNPTHDGRGSQINQG